MKQDKQQSPPSEGDLHMSSSKLIKLQTPMFSGSKASLLEHMVKD